MNALFDPRSGMIVAGILILALVFVAFLAAPQTTIDAVVALVKFILAIPVTLAKLVLIALQVVVGLFKVVLAVIGAILKVVTAVAT